MPRYETFPVEATLTVEVEGHRLTFAAIGKAKGCRGYDKYEPSLEASVQYASRSVMQQVAAKAEAFIARAYPVETESPGGEHG